MASITNHTGYPNGIPASRPMVAADVAANPAVFPGEELRARHAEELVEVHGVA